MLGDLAIGALIFLGGWYAGKKHDSLSDFKSAMVRRVKGWIS